MRICALFATILITVTVAAQTPLIEELQLARKHFELGDYERARINFESLEIYGGLAYEDARRLALCYESLGENDEAIYRWQEVMKYDNYTSSDLLALAQVLKKEARYDESLDFLRLYKQRQGPEAEHFIASCEFAKKVLENASNCDLENLQINTSSAESGVGFFNSELVYAKHRVDLDARFGLKGGLDKRPKSAIVALENVESNTTKPIRVQHDSDKSFGFVSYSANGELMVYVKSDFNADASGVQVSHQGMGLFYAQPDENGDWQEDKAFPYNSTEYDNGFPFVSEDGKTLYFASDMPGGHGGFDLYVSQYENGNWSAPLNLGESVNTKGNEITPYLANDKLYFASDWLPGLGGYDVFSIRNVENQWKDLAHMGACVNSPSDDFGFVVDPQIKSAYFSSTREGGKGSDDIYRIRDISTINEIDLVSTDIVEIPQITTSRQSESPASDLRVRQENHITIHKLSDIIKVKEKIAEMKAESQDQSMNTTKISSKDLPDLNMDVEEELVEEVVVADEIEAIEEENSKTEETATIELIPINDVETPQANQEIELAQDALSPDLDLISDEVDLKTEANVVAGIESVVDWNMPTTKSVKEEIMEIIAQDEVATPVAYEWQDNEIMEIANVSSKGISSVTMNHPSFEDLEVQLLAQIETDSKSADIETPEAILEVEELVDMTDVLMFDDPYLLEVNMHPQEKVYFIQIAALSSYTSNMDRFNHFRRYGNVYLVKVGKMVKVRIGYYHSQQEAVSVLRDIKRRGINEAFIVGDILDASRLELIASPLDDEEGEVINLHNDDLVPSYASKYKVRVASYQWPSQFQTSRIADLGHLEHWTKGPWKIIVLSGYSTRAQADEVLRQVRNRGYDDSFVVQDRNGTLQRIE